MIRFPYGMDAGIRRSICVSIWLGDQLKLINRSWNLLLQFPVAAIGFFDLLRRQINPDHLLHVSICPFEQVPTTTACKIQQSPRAARITIDEFAFHLVVETLQLEGRALRDQVTGESTPSQHMHTGGSKQAKAGEHAHKSACA